MKNDFENYSGNSGILIDSFLLSNFMDQTVCELKIVDGYLNTFEYAMIFSPFLNITEGNNFNSAFFAFEGTFR